MYTDLSRLIRTKEKLASVLDLFTEKSIGLKDYELFLTSCFEQRQAQWLGGSLVREMQKYQIQYLP